MSGWDWLYVATLSTAYDAYYRVNFRINSSKPLPYPRGEFSDYVTGGETGGYFRAGRGADGYYPTSIDTTPHKLDPYVVIRIDLNSTHTSIQIIRNSWITGAMHEWYGSSNYDTDFGAEYCKTGPYACRSFWLSNNDDDFQW